MVRMNQMEIVNKQDGLSAHDDVKSDDSVMKYHYGTRIIKNIP